MPLRSWVTRDRVTKTGLAPANLPHFQLTDACIGQCHVRCLIERVGHGLLEIGQTFGALAVLAQKNTEVVVRCTLGWLQCNRLAIVDSASAGC